ncbi:MAG: hypothetical protein KDA21_04450, partial [Phycisphaerales bacterium]|nr:hypothetical protein [Phycisphaerales bacterium]
LTGAAGVLQTPAVDVLQGGGLTFDNASVNHADRLDDATPILLDSGVLTFFTSSAGSSEDLGPVTVIGNAEIEVRPGSSIVSLPGVYTVDSITRLSRGLFWLRGQNLGNTGVNRHATLHITGTPPALTGGGGAVGTPQRSIIPWAMATSSTMSSTANANTFVTYDAAAGLRPLDLGTEYIFTLGVTPDQNVRLTSPAHNDGVAEVNALLISADITGTGTIEVGSGAVLCTASSYVDNNLAFGSTEAVIMNPDVMVLTGSMTGTNGLTKGGKWPLVLSSDNSGLTGPLLITGSIGNSRIDVRNEAALPGTGPVVIRSTQTTGAAGIGVSNNLDPMSPVEISRDIVIESGLAGLATLNSSTVGIFSGDISGNGGVVINSAGSWGTIVLTGNNSYDGITRVHTGNLRIESDANLGNGGAVVLASNVETQGLEIAADWITSRRVDVLYQTGFQTNEFDAVLNGPLTGSNPVHKYGSGSIILNHDSPFRSSLVVWEGGVEVNATSPATVELFETRLGGTGRVGDVFLYGSVAPGSQAQPQATLSMNALLWYGTSSVDFDLGPAGDLLAIDTAMLKDTSTGTTFPFHFTTMPGLAPGQTWELARFGFTDFDAADFSFTGPAGLAGSFEIVGGALRFHVTAVPPTCDGDDNGDGMVNCEDLNRVLNAWGTRGPVGDVNGDGTVDFDDLNEVLAAWGTTCP